MSAPLGLAEAARAIADRTLSPVELLADCRARSETLQPKLNAILLPLWDKAAVAAKEAEAEIAARGPRSPLHGIPVGLKDIIDLEGEVTTCHSRILLENRRPADSAVAAKLRAAGALFPAKLATHEFAIGGPAFDLPFPPARNPWNPAHHPGGSSSGSGSAVAAGMLLVALGTDTGGSVRHPASHCGIVGLKPTYGLVSRRGVFPLAFTLDHVGPMTRSVEDCALLLNAIAGHDAADPGSAARAPEDFAAALGRGLKGLRVGFIRHFFEVDQPAEAEMGAAIHEAARIMAAEGATVRDVTLPSLGEFAGVNRTILLSEAGAIHEPWLRERPGDYAHITRRRLLPGAFVTGPDYVQAQRRRRQLIAAIEAAFADCDVLLTASSMETACLIDDADAVERTYPRQARTPFNVSGHPAVTVPSGLSSAGMPLSIQLIGRYFGDAALLGAAAGWERAKPWPKVAPG